MKEQFDLTSTFSLKGDWYLPGTEKRLSGEVSYSPGKGISLELIGDFRENPLGLDESNYATIQGIVEGSRDITLFGCLLVGRSTVSLVRGSEIAKPVKTYSVRSMVDGWHYGAYEEVRCHTVYVQFDGLAEWLRVSGFKFNDVKIDHEAKTVDVHYQLPKPISFEFPKGVNASFDFSLNNISLPVFRTSFEMEQVARLKLESSDGMTLDDVLRITYRFLTFLMMGLGGESFVKGIQFFNTDTIVQMPDGSTHKRETNFFYHQHFTVRENKWDFRSVTFGYPAIKDNFQQILDNWERNFSDFEPAINLIVEQFREKSTFTDNDFLNLAQAAETLHDRIYPGALKMPKGEYKSLMEKILNTLPETRKDFVQGLLQFGNNVSLRQRLNELVAMCPEDIHKLFIPDKEVFVNEVLDSRNYYTHYTLSGKKHVKRGRDLMLLTKRMHLLLIVDILLHIGISSDLLVQLFDNQKYQLQWLIE